MSREDKLKAIHDKMAKKRNVGDEFRWDYYIYEVNFGNFTDYIYCKNLHKKFTVNELAKIWTNLWEDINSQTDECIDFVYSLI